MRRRPCWVETVFADLKANHTLGRGQFRGLAFEVQALLAAAAHNIEQLTKGRPRGVEVQKVFVLLAPV